MHVVRRFLHAGFVLALLSANSVSTLAVGEVSAGSRPIEVKADPRLELVSTVFRLARHPEYRRAPDSAYLRRVDEHFEAFREHAVVQLATAFRVQAGISFDAPQSLAVHLSRDAKLDLLVPLDPWPSALDERWRKVDVDVFLRELRDFAEKSKFFEFFASERDFYAKLEDAYRKGIETDDPVAWFDEFFGSRPDSTFTLVPAALNGPNSYGPRLVDRDGKESYYQIVGVSGFDAAGAPAIGTEFVPVVIHEIAHSYCNPLIDGHLVDLESAGERLFRGAERAMRSQHYGDGRTVLRESLVRACVVLYALARDGEEGAARALADEESRSFFWTADLVAAIRKARERSGRATDSSTRSIREIMPAVVAAFRSAAAKKEWSPAMLPFRGPVNAAFSRTPIVVVAPDRTSKIFSAYLDQLEQQIFKKLGATRTAAGKMSRATAAGSTLILYGTFKDHPLLGKVAREAGWSFEKDKLELGARTFEDENLVLIACWPSPFAKNRAAVVYAANDLDTLAGVNGIFHGSTDWLVARREANGSFTVIDRGNFAKDLENRWRPLEK